MFTVKRTRLKCKPFGTVEDDSNSYPYLLTKYLPFKRFSYTCIYVCKYAEKCEVISHLCAEETIKEACWPTVGKIEFRHVSLCYDINLDPVVNDISFSVKPGEKVSF